MRRQISKEQRYQIDALLKVKTRVSEIARIIGVHRSSVYREIERNSKQTYKDTRYDPDFANHLTQMRHKMKAKNHKFTDCVIRRIHWLIKRLWSPEQIYKTCLARKVTMVSIESIYLYLYDLKRKGLDLCKYLRRHHRKRRKRGLNNQPRQLIKNRVSIDKRPAGANNASRIGHMEVDLMKCKNGYLLTLTDRKTTYNIIRKLKDKSSQSVKQAFQTLGQYQMIIKTITSDNGLEFTAHQQCAKLLNVKWYFADPYSPQQRGCNENQNGLIRQYANRNTDLNLTSEEQILAWQKQLNYRPRKKLNFKKPIECFKSKSVAFIT